MAKKSTKTPPRNVPERDDYYMGLAFWIASKSKDPATQNGAVIVSQSNRIIGTGYNGPPAPYDDDAMDWSRPFKYPHIIHAEENAIDCCTAHWQLPGSTIYITARPCKNCILRLANVRISKVVWFPMNHDPESMVVQDAELIEDIGKRSKLELVEFKGNLNWMRDRLAYMVEKLNIF